MIWQKYKWWRFAIEFGSLYQGGICTITSNGEKWRSLAGTRLYFLVSKK